ncbi:MAG TPA: FecR family protein [Kofleriaceae bacterium]|nr:FecR family protein [Kofleriaceae bacterium]
MTPDLDRIVVDVPAADSSQHRVEPRLFEQLDGLRAAQRARRVAPDRSPVLPRWAWVVAGTMAIAIVILVVHSTAGHGTGEHATGVTPSLVVTPAGGSSRFTIDDALIEAGSDTSVAVATDSSGGVTLSLARGTIECDVAPRHGRPFRVIAGDVTVEVVGTRFTVARHPDVQVDVAHGKVRVHANDRDVFVAAGERWPATTETAQVPPAPAVPVEPVAPVPQRSDPVLPPAPEPHASPHDAFIAAQRLEAHDWTQAARAYRTVARGGDRWAALALYSLAELDAAHDHASDALSVLDDYQRRFPSGASGEDAAWLRVEVLRSLGRSGDARAAAAAYLARYPAGTYVTPASRLAPP